jgi:hypothetical protein
MMRWLVTLLMTQFLWFGSTGMIAASASDGAVDPVIVLTGVVKSKTEWGPPV